MPRYKARAKHLWGWGEHVGNHQPGIRKSHTDSSESNRPNDPQSSQGLAMAPGPISQGEQPSSMHRNRRLTPKALLIASIWSSCHLKATLKIPYKLQIFQGPNVNPRARIKAKLKIWQLVQKCEPFKLRDTTTSLKNVQIFSEDTTDQSSVEK